MRLDPLPGHFSMFPEHQEHTFMLSNGVSVREDVFTLNRGSSDGNGDDPPAVYVVLELTNDSTNEQHVGTYAFCELDSGMVPSPLGVLHLSTQLKPQESRC